MLDNEGSKVLEALVQIISNNLGHLAPPQMPHHVISHIVTAKTVIQLEIRRNHMFVSRTPLPDILSIFQLLLGILRGHRIEQNISYQPIPTWQTMAQ